jgi:DNA topoisomerase-1
MIIHRNHNPGSGIKDKRYIFTDSKGAVVTDDVVLASIKKMSIPPAYAKVRIDLSPCAKIIYEGIDEKRRLQQKYSAAHTKKAKRAKFCRLIEFGKSEPRMKSDIKKYIASTRITQNKIISLILAIIWRCGFRIGNRRFLKLYGSHGIGNIYKKHLTFLDSSLKIEFVGKKSVVNKCSITDKELIKEIKSLVSNKKDTDHVFTYKKNKENVLIKATEINNFLGGYGKITSKDLRTFDVNILFIDFMRTKEKELKEATSVVKRKKIAKEALILTSSHINNTPGICKSSYILTDIYDLAIENPKKFKSHFGSKVASRIAFINFLEKVYCK